MSVRYRLGPPEGPLKGIGHDQVGDRVSLDAELFRQAERSEAQQRPGLGDVHQRQRDHEGGGDRRQDRDARPRSAPEPARRANSEQNEQRCRAQEQEPGCVDDFRRSLRQQTQQTEGEKRIDQAEKRAPAVE